MAEATSVGQTYLAQCLRRLDDGFGRIRHCVDQLSDEQVWWRPHEAMNSIANILLHLRGNLQQWIIAGVLQQADQRNRPQEFAERRTISKRELLGRLEQVVGEAKKVLGQLGETQLLETRRIQGFDESVLSATFGSISHLGGHVQEIVYITRLQLGDSYRFAWVPATPEQGAPPS